MFENLRPAFKTRQRDESLRYSSEPVVMYSITPSIVTQKRKILNCRKKSIFNLAKNLKNAASKGVIKIGIRIDY